MLRQEFYQIILAIISMLIFILATASKAETNKMWAKCVDATSIKDCKLVGDKVFINGKDMNVTKLDVIYLNEKVNILIGSKR